MNSQGFFRNSLISRNFILTIKGQNNNILQIGLSYFIGARRILFPKYKSCRINKQALYIIDPCECHISIDDEERSTKFMLSKDSKVRKCDSQMGNRWFRFISGAGGLIPTSAPQQNACGKILT